MCRVLKFLPVSLVLVPAISYAGVFGFLKNGTSEDLQQGFDTVRLNDLAQLSGYTEQYKEVAGKHPFQNETELPYYAYIATEEQVVYAKGGVKKKTGEARTKTKTKNKK